MTEYKKYQPENIKFAVEAIQRSGKSIRSAAIQFGVPESTLRSRLKKPDPLSTTEGTSQYFTHVEEDHFAKHCVKMASLGFYYQQWQVLELASSMCEEKGMDISPTRRWYHGFLSRHPQFAAIKPKELEKTMTDNTTESEENLWEYFVELERILKENNILNIPAQIWSVGETVLFFTDNQPKVISFTDTRTDQYITQGKSLTTVLATGNALGETVPPYIVFKGNCLSDDLKIGGLTGSRYAVTPSGKSNVTTFSDYFENHFLKHIAVRPCVLLYGGHSTHVTTAVIEKARSAGVMMFVLPPHTTNISQPLNVGIFSRFKIALTNECHKYIHNHPGQLVTKYELSAIISSSYKKALSVPFLQSGFRKTGILPFYPDTLISSFCHSANEASQPKKLKLSHEECQSSCNIKSASDNQDSKCSDARKTCEESPVKRNRRTCSPSSRGIAAESEMCDDLQAHPVPSNFPFADLEPVDCGSDEEQVPGVSEIQNVYLQLDTDQSETDEVDDSNCLMCDRRVPPLAPKLKSEDPFEWAQCEICNGWCHLQYCVPEKHVGPDDPFFCPFCK